MANTRHYKQNEKNRALPSCLLPLKKITRRIKSKRSHVGPFYYWRRRELVKKGSGDRGREAISHGDFHTHRHTYACARRGALSPSSVLSPSEKLKLVVSRDLHEVIEELREGVCLIHQPLRASQHFINRHLSARESSAVKIKADEEVVEKQMAALQRWASLCRDQRKWVRKAWVVILLGNLGNKQEVDELPAQRLSGSGELPTYRSAVTLCLPIATGSIECEGRQLGLVSIFTVWTPATLLSTASVWP
ncbi:hypothetical protein J6590_018075 [Homalodisca vitripennis]|nr:hypothetical protein J6590_018075 [Homalodisca vitripennis]